MIPLKDIGRTEPVFTHIDEDGITVTTFAVDRLKKAPEFLALEIVRTPVDAEGARFCREHRGVEQHRLDRITIDTITYNPVIYCNWAGGTHLLIDGTHRYVKASMLGLPFILARVVPEEIWRPFQVESMPLDMAKAFTSGFSGIV